jgi:hypothetical protein
MNLKVTPYHFEELIKKSYSLDLIFLLKLIEEQMDIQPLCTNSMKVAALHQTLIRKGLITDTEDKLTTLGIELLQFIKSEESTKIVKKKPATTEFEEWWKAYPGTDNFTHKGKKFVGSRTLRSNRDECRLRFDKILLEGEYTAADLIAALEFDVLQKKENSVKTGTNRLSYMQSSATYLNQRSYEPFIELIKDGAKIEEAPIKPTGGTDI